MAVVEHGKVWAGSLSRLKVRAVPHDEKCAVQNSSHRTKLRRRKRFLGAMIREAKVGTLWFPEMGRGVFDLLVDLVN